ncbi:putative chromosome-partitioning protein ParB [Gammaproteobacteria bacterium]
MSAKRRGLGRGLDALLGRPLADDNQPVPDAATPTTLMPVSAGEQTHLPLDVIQRGRYQPRREFSSESLQELADSITAQGVIQPIVVRPLATGRYELIAGERRWRAAQLAGLLEIPAVIREVGEDAAMAIGLIENIQREDLNPLEQAQGLQRLLEEFDLTHQDLAQAVGKSRAAVSNLLRLLDLTEEVKGQLLAGGIEMGHARALLGLLDPPRQIEAAHQVVSGGLSVRETEEMVRRMQNEEPPRPRRNTGDPNVRRLESDLSERLGAKVMIRQGSKGAGRLTIAYHSLDELEGILARIQ